MPSEPMLALDQVVQSYGPQLGEILWHSVQYDNTIETASAQHAEQMLSLIKAYDLNPADRPIRILEIGAYAHFGVSITCAKLSGQAVGWTHDISPTALRVGASEASSRNLPPSTLVAGDFHDLPFSDNFFDLVFCASCAHHTYRPERVLSELMRVARPNGIVRLHNEPVSREFCFYQFRGNRPELRTAFEKQLESLAMTWVISSPFPGSRPEALFGMIENDLIPLSLYTTALAKSGRIDSLDLIPQVSSFEKRVLALDVSDNLVERIEEEISKDFKVARATRTVIDDLLGFDLPNADQVWRMSYRVAERLRQIARLTGAERTRAEAELFGATLRATVVKDDEHVTASEPMARSLAFDDGVWVDVTKAPNIKLDLSHPMLPAIENGSKEEVEAVYSTKDWIYYKEGSGLFTLLNRSNLAHIPLPTRSTTCIMMCRFYGVQRKSGAPYAVNFRDASTGELYSQQVICQSESRLARFLVPVACFEIAVEFVNLDAAPADDIHAHMHLAVARLLPVSAENSALASNEEQYSSDLGAQNPVPAR